jgi:hypothetical protein
VLFHIFLATGRQLFANFAVKSFKAFNRKGREVVAKDAKKGVPLTCQNCAPRAFFGWFPIK